jgi:signal transduction histidine kinase
MSSAGPFSSLLKAYDTTDPLEQRRLGYIVLVELGLLFMFCSITVIHFIFGMHPVHFFGDLGGVFSILFSIYSLRQGRLALAGTIMVWCLVGVLFVYGVAIDYVAPGPVQYLRLYITLFSIMGIFLLIVSVFRTFRQFVLLAIILTLITALHAYIIVKRNGGTESITRDMWSYFLIGVVTVYISGFITAITTTFNRELMKRHKTNMRTINQHNLNLNAIVERQTAELKESNERLLSFAHIASHDLKEPLRSISGFITLVRKHLQTHYPEDKTVDEYMGYVTTGAQRMHHLINDILAFSKLNSRQKEFTPIDLNNTIDEVKVQLDTIIGFRKATITYTALPVISGQPNLILQVFLNLLSNAIRYTPADRAPAIALHCVQKNEVYEITVRDNGIGIPAHLTRQIFMPYYSVNKKVQDENTGMGLAICKKIIEFHGGDIWVESVEGEGSTFYCTFPVEVKE